MDDQILSLEHISLSYHTMKGETPALCDLTFSVKPGGICCSCRTERLRKEHDPELDFRSFKAGGGNSAEPRTADHGGGSPYRLHAAERPPV